MLVCLSPGKIVLLLLSFHQGLVTCHWGGEGGVVRTCQVYFRGKVVLICFLWHRFCPVYIPDRVPLLDLYMSWHSPPPMSHNTLRRKPLIVWLLLGNKAEIDKPHHTITTVIPLFYLPIRLWREKQTFYSLREMKLLFFFCPGVQVYLTSKQFQHCQHIVMWQPQITGGRDYLQMSKQHHSPSTRDHFTGSSLISAAQPDISQIFCTFIVSPLLAVHLNRDGNVGFIPFLKIWNLFYSPSQCNSFFVLLRESSQWFVGLFDVMEWWFFCWWHGDSGGFVQRRELEKKSDLNYREV